MKQMKIAVLSPIAWRTPPRHYGPWELISSLLTEELVNLGHDVTLFATGDSVTKAKLKSVCPAGYEEDKAIDPKVWECLHISSCFEHAGEFDIIHNHFDFLPLSYASLVKTPVITTIHGFSSPKILPVYKKFADIVGYVSISDADRSKDLPYLGTVYHGIDISQFTFESRPKDEYLLYFGRIHPDKGTAEAIEIARLSGRRLVMAGIVQDREYFDKKIAPSLKEGFVDYIGSAGPEKRNQLFGGALALLHPISFAEPFGLSVVEAMACGTPAIAFNKGSMPEIIDDGKTGFLVSNTDEAVFAVKQAGSIDRRACREEAEKRFTKERMALEYVRIYDKYLADKRGGK
jgi:glycosyltransferase involved in cell wall biosynthesis